MVILMRHEQLELVEELGEILVARVALGGMDLCMLRVEEAPYKQLI
jgi:hypothetical protein